MKGANLKFPASGQAVVIGMAVASLLLFGCSKREDSSKADQRPGSASNALQQTPTTKAVADWVPSEVLKQFADLKVKAERGDAQAQFELGTNFWQTDLKEAMKWFLKAAEQDHKEACLYAGSHFSWSASPTNDPSKGFEFFLRGARLGDAACQYFAGQCYIFGEGTAANVPEGVRWAEKSANQGYATAQWALAGWYYQGEVVPRNLTNAIHYYQFRAEAGDGRAQFRLGYIHATETKNIPEAMKWFQKGAEKGDTSAQCNLALLYYKGGKGVASDWQEAAAWYRKAAEAGNAEAQANLAAMHRDGEGVPRDDGEAVKWFRKAAEQGNCPAQHDLGLAYSKGEGIPRDYVEAYKWYNLATAGAADAEQRETARKNLDGITRYMTRDQIAEAQRRSSAFVARKEAADARGPWEDFASNTPKATGTAFFITEDGYLLTSAHVISPPEPKTAEEFLDARRVTRIEVTVAGKTYSAKLVKADKANDVAVLKIIGESQRTFTFEEASQPEQPAQRLTKQFVPLPLAASRGVKLGETICTLGFPNTDIQGTELKFTTGEINSLAGIQDDPRHFQISVAVQPGNSGGPLLDASGNVIGLVSARLADIATLKITGSLPQNVNYALKSSFITAFLETLPEVSAKLKSPRPVKARPLAEIAEEVKSSVALVTVY